LALYGCAKFPENGGERSKRLSFTITLADEARLGLPGDSRGGAYYYFVCIDTDPAPGNGPIPVIAAPWGNGYAAGRFDFFVVIGPFNGQPVGQYVVYRVLDPGTQNQVVAQGAPVRVTTPQLGDRVLQFGLDINQITLPAQPNPTQVQVNILTTNQIPTDPNGSYPSRLWEALGNGQAGELNRFITLDLLQDVTYDNAYFGNLEPTGDVADPTLDVTNFVIQISS